MSPFSPIYGGTTFPMGGGKLDGTGNEMKTDRGKRPVNVNRDTGASSCTALWFGSIQRNRRSIGAGAGDRRGSRNKDRTCRAGWAVFWEHQPVAGQRVRRNLTDVARRTVLRQMMRHVARGNGLASSRAVATRVQLVFVALASPSEGVRRNGAANPLHQGFRPVRTHEPSGLQRPPHRLKLVSFARGGLPTGPA